MLPIYLSYFTAGGEEDNRGVILRNALGFVLGFTVVFLILGGMAGLAGGLLRKYQTAVNIITGGIVVIFGLNYLKIIKIDFLNRSGQSKAEVKILGFWSAVLFGIVFSISWTPCVGAFLGSALMMASNQGSAIEGIAMLLCFSAGLAIPFILSAILIDSIKSAVDFIKRNYSVINKISGSLLIIIGILMMTGYMNYFLSLLTF